jgi:hypothetical protein
MMCFFNLRVELTMHVWTGAFAGEHLGMLAELRSGSNENVVDDLFEIGCRQIDLPYRPLQLSIRS